MQLTSPALQVADFRRLLLGRLFTTFGLQIQAVIVGWQIYQIRPSAWLLGMIGLTEAVPAIASSFYSGHVVDQSRPHRILLVSGLVLLLNTLLLTLAVLPFVSLSDSMRLLVLFGGVFISGAARSFVSPSVFSLVPQILPRSLLSSASAFNSTTYQLAAVIGPAVGGLIYGTFGAEAAFFTPPLMMLAALLQISLFSPAVQALKNEGHREPFFTSLRAGLRFAFGHKIMLSTMSLDMFSVLFGGAVAVLPIFADQVFHTGAAGLGVLRAAPAIGSVLVGGWLAFKPLRKLTGRLLMLVIVGFGISTLLFALSPNVYWALFFLALTGAFDGVSMVIRGTFFQIIIPENMRGRVSALNSIFITSSNEIGAFESGVAASLMGLIPSVIFGGAMTLVVVAGVAWLVPALARTWVDQDGHLHLAE